LAVENVFKYHISQGFLKMKVQWIEKTQRALRRIKMQVPTEISRLFVQAMNDKLATGEQGVDFRGFDVLAGRSYDKIVVVHTPGKGMPEKIHSVHAFINRETGDLVKAATLKAFQKNSDGTPAVRYYMANPAEVKAVVAQADMHGRYLYQ
jgi:hypothetical protein